MAVDDVGVDRAHRRLVEPEPARRRACAGCGAGCRPRPAARRSPARAAGDLRSRATPRLPRWQPKNDHSTQRMPFAARRFDLHHVGAEVGEQHRPERTGEERARVDHLHALERPAELGAGGGRGTLRRARGFHSCSTSSVCAPSSGCEPTHARRRVDGQGRARHRDPAEVGMVDLDDVAVGPRLLVGEDLAERQRGLHGHVVGPERSPATRRSGAAAAPRPSRRTCWNSVSGSLRGPSGRTSAMASREQRRLRRFTHQVDPHAVAGSRTASPRSAPSACPIASDGDGLLDPAPVHRHRHQRALGQLRVRRPGVPGALAGDQAGDDADRGEVGGAPAADRAAEEDRTVAVALLLVEHAQARHRQQLVDGRSASAWLAGHDSTDDTIELRVALGQRGVVEAELARTRRTVVVHQHVGGREQVVEPGPVVGLRRGRARRCACCASRCGTPAVARLAAPLGGSTATTSAPASASSSVATGPAMPSDRSTMRMPSRMPASEVTPSGAAIVSPLRGQAANLTSGVRTPPPTMPVPPSRPPARLHCIFGPACSIASPSRPPRHCIDPT